MRAAEADTTVDAPLEACLEVILDMEAYPAWVPSYRRVEVRARDERGRPERVFFEVGGLGFGAAYTLAYSYDDAPAVVAFRQVEGSVTRAIEGRYVLQERGSGTLVRFGAAVELAIKAPGPVKRTAERIVMGAALRSLAQEVRRRHSP